MASGPRNHDDDSLLQEPFRGIRDAAVASVNEASGSAPAAAAPGTEEGGGSAAAAGPSRAATEAPGLSAPIQLLQEDVDEQRERENDHPAAAAPGTEEAGDSAAAAAASHVAIEAPGPSAPVQLPQEEVREQRERENDHPAAATLPATAASSYEALISAAADIDRKGKKVAVAAPLSSTDSKRLDEEANKRVVTWNEPLVTKAMEPVSNQKTAFKELLMDARELQMAMQIAKENAGQLLVIPPKKPLPKLIWSKVKNLRGESRVWLVDGAGRRRHFLVPKAIQRWMGDSTTGLHVAEETIPMAGAPRYYGLYSLKEIRELNVMFLHQIYSEFRPVLGDGECFYRGFIYSYLEQVLDRDDTDEEHRLLATVKRVATLYWRLGWSPGFFRLHSAFKNMIKKVMRWKTQGRWSREASTNSYRKLKLLSFFSDYAETQDIFAFLRLVAAAWMCSHTEEYQVCVPSNLKEWCKKNVIEIGMYADHLQMRALANALGVTLRVVNLMKGPDHEIYTAAAPNDAPSCSSSRPPPAGQLPCVNLLYTGNHYDVIYSRARRHRQNVQRESC